MSDIPLVAVAAVVRINNSRTMIADQSSGAATMNQDRDTEKNAEYSS